MNKFFAFKNMSDGSVEIDIFDKVIGWDTLSGEFREELAKVKSATSITLNLNSPGGVITEGLAIYGMLREVSDKLTVRVYGVAASIASVIALAGSKLEMAEGSFLMIHDPFISGFIEGKAEELQSMAEALNKMKKQICNIYQRKTGLAEDVLLKYMEDESWFSAAEAVELGFADEVLLENMKAVAQFDIGAIRNEAGYSRYKASIPQKTDSSDEPVVRLDEKELLLKVEELTALVKEALTLIKNNAQSGIPNEGQSSEGATPNAEQTPKADFLDLVVQAANNITSQTPKEG